MREAPVVDHRDRDGPVVALRFGARGVEQAFDVDGLHQQAGSGAVVELHVSPRGWGARDAARGIPGSGTGRAA